MEQFLENNYTEVDVTDLAEGMYVVMISNERSRVSSKIVVSR